jgi:histidinol-phosphate aminotransferase
LAVGLRDLGFEVPDAQGNFVWLPGGPLTQEYAAAFARAGLAVRAFASGSDWDGLRITVGEPAANARVLEVAATLKTAVADELG